MTAVDGLDRVELHDAVCDHGHRTGWSAAALARPTCPGGCR